MTRTPSNNPSCARLKGEGAWTVRKRITEDSTLWDVHCGGKVIDGGFLYPVLVNKLVKAHNASIGEEGEAPSGKIRIGDMGEFTGGDDVVYQCRVTRVYADGLLEISYTRKGEKIDRAYIPDYQFSPNVAGASEEEKETPNGGIASHVHSKQYHETDLAPCPFCGRECHVGLTGQLVLASPWYAWCNYCLVHLYGPTREEVVTKWNQRAQGSEVHAPQSPSATPIHKSPSSGPTDNDSKEEEFVRCRTGNECWIRQSDQKHLTSEEVISALRARLEFIETENAICPSSTTRRSASGR